MWLLEEVIESFSAGDQKGVGLPLGNVTSQLLINVYMNEFDQFMKRELKVKYYIRYCDDFIVLHKDKFYLENLIPQVSEFLGSELNLSLHSDKVFVKKLSSGVDFLGWVHFNHHRILRRATKRRMLKKLNETRTEETINSYLGLLKHGNTYKLVKRILDEEY